MGERFYIDPSQRGLAMMLSPWEVEVLNYVLKAAPPDGGKELTTRAIFLEVDKIMKAKGGPSISRASVINFLKRLKDIGALQSKEETCKGGTRDIYTARLNEAGFRRLLIRITMRAFKESWPNEYNQFIENQSPTV